MRRGEVADRMRGQVPGWVPYPPRPRGQPGAHRCERSTRSLGSGWRETRPPKQVAHMSSAHTQNGVVLPLVPKLVCHLPPIRYSPQKMLP